MSVRRRYGDPGQGLFVSVCHCEDCDQQYRGTAASDALVTRNPFPYEPTGHSRFKNTLTSSFFA